MPGQFFFPINIMEKHVLSQNEKGYIILTTVPVLFLNYFGANCRPYKLCSNKSYECVFGSSDAHLFNLKHKMKKKNCYLRVKIF